MVRERINGHSVLLYDSISELPAWRHDSFNLYLMMDADIGGDMDSVQGHIARMSAYVQREDIKSLAIELENYSQTLLFIVSNLNPEFMCFAALVKEVDGEPYEDLSAEGVKELMSKLNGAPVSLFARIVDAFKKKSEIEHETYFPELALSGVNVEFYNLLKKRAIMVYDGILSGEKPDTKEIDDRMLDLTPPRMYSGSRGVEVSHRRAFNEICVLLSQEIPTDPKHMTVTEFTQAYLTLKKQKNG